jgi:hypothetical protein
VVHVFKNQFQEYFVDIIGLVYLEEETEVLGNVYTMVFWVKRLNKRMWSVMLLNWENHGINDLEHEAMQYHI